MFSLRGVTGQEGTSQEMRLSPQKQVIFIQIFQTQEGHGGVVRRRGACDWASKVFIRAHIRIDHGRSITVWADIVLEVSERSALAQEQVNWLHFKHDLRIVCERPPSTPVWGIFLFFYDAIRQMAFNRPLIEALEMPARHWEMTNHQINQQNQTKPPNVVFDFE